MCSFHPLGLVSVWFTLLERSASFVHLNTGASDNEIFVMHAQFAYIVYSSNVVRKAVMDEGRDSREDLFPPFLGLVVSWLLLSVAYRIACLSEG